MATYALRVGCEEVKVRVGNSVELANTEWRKSDVELDETDLTRLLAEAGLPLDIFIPAQKAFLILEAEGQRLLLAIMIRRYSLMFDSEQSRKQLQEFQKQRDAILNSLRVPDEHRG